MLYLIGLFTGITSALLAYMLDDWMDYGNILYKVREWFVKRSMKRQGYNFYDSMKPIFEAHEWQQREEAFRELSWLLAMDDFWLTGWLCRVCMAARVNLILVLIEVVWMLKMGMSADIIFIAAITSFAVCHYVVKKL